MELDEYQTPDPYAPREKASQLYAAAKRGAAAKAETGKLKAETGDPAPFPLSSFSSQLSAKGRGIGMALIIFAMIALASYQLSHLPAGPLVVPPKIAPVASPEARRATIAPAPVHPPAEVPQIAVYAAPGALLGTIEADRQITPIAHYGTDWIQADVEGSGRVWLRAADWPALAIVGVDLEPHEIAPQTGQGMPVYQESAPAEKPASDKGQKEAPDRAVRHATAVAGEVQP